MQGQQRDPTKCTFQVVNGFKHCHAQRAPRTPKNPKELLELRGCQAPRGVGKDSQGTHRNPSVNFGMS
eukprot:11455766-Karenia_brevis.AAC.1